jgi:hypothetical protein
MELYEHYPWQDYWGGGYYAGGIWSVTYPSSVLDEKIIDEANNNDKMPEGDVHLRSTHAVAGYDIHATDGQFGHVTDFIMDNHTWKLVYLVVDTHNWFGQKKVLLEVQHITEVQWADSKVCVDITIAAVENCRRYDERELKHAESGHTANNKLALHPGWAHL